MTIVVMGSFATGFKVPVRIVNVRRAENLFEAAEVAEKCGDFATRDQLLEQSVALLGPSAHRSVRTVAA